MQSNIVSIQGELDLDPVVAQRCEERLALARTHMAAGFYHWLEAGKQFAAIKADLAKEGSRHWLPWLRQHDVAQPTADFLIRVSDRFSSIQVAATLMDATDLQIDFRALQVLVSPETPIIVVEQAIEHAADGEHITKAKAEEMVEAARIEAAEKALAAATAETRREREEALNKLRAQQEECRKTAAEAR